MSAEVSTVTISVGYRSTTGGILVNYRQNVGRVSFDSRERKSTDRTCVLKVSVYPKFDHFSKKVFSLFQIDRIAIFHLKKIL